MKKLINKYYLKEDERIYNTSMKNWMKIETETIYGDTRVILYDGDVYDNDEKLNPAVQLADMYLNMAMPNKETGKCDIIVLDKLTADFWFNIIEEQKEKAFKQGSKETAEKITKKIKRTAVPVAVGKYSNMKFIETSEEELNTIAKQFGAEIKE